MSHCNFNPSPLKWRHFSSLPICSLSLKYTRCPRWLGLAHANCVCIICMENCLLPFVLVKEKSTCGWLWNSLNIDKLSWELCYSWNYYLSTCYLTATFLARLKLMRTFKTRWWVYHPDENFSFAPYHLITSKDALSADFGLRNAIIFKCNDNQMNIVDE